jgi:hypothetical protein
MEVITLLKKGLQEEMTNRERVMQMLERIKSRDVPAIAKELDATQIIREIREERTIQILKNNGFATKE